MKKIIVSLLLLGLLIFAASFSVAKQDSAFTTGEFFKFRIHYGMVNAGYATLETDRKSVV